MKTAQVNDMRGIFLDMPGRKLGPYREITDQWKRDVKIACKLKGITQRELAKAAGCSPAAITWLLKPTGATRTRPGTSRIAQGVADACGVPLPIGSNEKLQHAIRELESLFEKNQVKFDHYTALLDDLLKK